MSKLTQKQERFCLAFVEGSNATRAYRQAYDCERMKNTTVNRNAKREMDKSKIRARILDLQAMHRERHEINIDLITAMLLRDRQLAREEKKPDAAISAVMAIAKLHGLVTVKANLNVNADHKHHHTVEPLSETVDWVAELLGTGANRPARSH